MSVADERSLAVAGNLDGRLVAVAGDWSQMELTCPAIPHDYVMNGFCTGISFSDSNATPQPGIGDENVIVPLESTNGNELYSSQTQTSPGAVVVIGHAGDSRSWQCPPDGRAACEQKFVIDRVAWANGQALEPGSPNSDITLAQLNLTPDQAAAIGVHSGETLITAYPFHALDMNTFDPRFLGVGTDPPDNGGVSRVLWLVRVSSGSADGDGTTSGVVRVIDDASGDLLAEKSLTVAADYQPARVLLETSLHSNGDFGNSFYPRGSVNANGVALYADYVGFSSTPLAIDAGAYDLVGFVGNENGGDVGIANCSLPITLEAQANVAYAATFTKTSCSWAPSTSEF